MPENGRGVSMSVKNIGEAMKQDRASEHQGIVETTNAVLSGVSGIVLAGDYHWTGSLFEELRPRSLFPVALTPIIDHVTRWFQGGGVQDVSICANGSTPVLKRYLESREHPGMRFAFVQDHSPRGAAGCVKDAAAATGADTFVVTDGASIPTADLTKLVAQHKAAGAALTVVVHERRSTQFESHHSEPTGTYVISREALNMVPATSFQDIKETLVPKLYKEGLKIELFYVDEVSPRLLNASRYLTINRWFLDRMARTDGASVAGHNEHAGESFVHPTAWVEAGASLIGPVVLGPGVRIRSSATIVGPTVIGAGTTVGAGATVSRSIIWNNCTIGEHATVDRSFLADDVNVPSASTVTGALRVESPERSLFRLGRRFFARRPDTIPSPGSAEAAVS